MLTNENESGNIKNIIHSYIKRGEKYTISGEIELKGKVYQEISFYKKKYLGAFSEKTGYLYIDEQGSIVPPNKNFFMELVKLAHFYEIFFSEEKKLGIQNAIDSKGIVFDRGDLKDIAKILEEFQANSLEGAAEIKAVVLKLPVWNEKISENGKELNSRILEFKSSTKRFSEETLKDFYPLYEEILITNFQKVRDIGSTAPFCDDVKSASDKKRKNYAVRFNQKLVNGYNNLGYEISYFRRIIRTYSPVLNFSVNEYTKYLNGINNEKIKNRASLVRG